MVLAASAHVDTVSGLGACCFGAVVGWFLYYVLRHGTDKITLTDVSTLIAAIGGAAVLSLFPSGSRLFGWYGLGLFGGFFAYFLVLVVMVGVSRRYNIDFFLGGIGPKLGPGERDTGQTPLGHDTPPE